MDWQYIGGSVDAGDEPTCPRSAGKNGGSPRVAYKAARFVPPRGSVAKNLERFRWQGFKKLRPVGIMNNAARQNNRGSQLMRGGGRAGVFLGRTSNGRQVHRPNSIACKRKNGVQLSGLFRVTRFVEVRLAS